MKKSWMLISVGALLAAGSLAMSARAQNNVVYAAEYNQSTNRFGTINLLNGNFTKISSFGNALINDIAYCPTNGTLYGISNTTALVTFNKTNGAITTIGNLVSGIESLAFRPSDGALFGATSSKLYTINPATGTATLVGSYGSPTKLGTTGQNIRFAQDGNLYVSNTSTNTDIYRINIASGAATWMGETVGYPYLILMNASSNMYGVYINLGTSTNPIPKLVTFDLSSFVNGGTNANGSTHQVTVILVGAGTNFPANFNFSGNVPQAVTNLTVPASATGPSNQTVSAGSTAVFSTVASGTGPYNYAWSKNGAAISGQTNSSLTLNNVTTGDAATYSVIVGGAMGTVTNSATLTVTKASATVTLGSLNQTYNGTAKPATATTTPTGLTVNLTYNGVANVPTNAGSYTVIGTINDSNYQGSATNTLVIAQASGSITLGSLNQTYNGTAKPVTATTTPSGLTVSFTYNGSATVPTSAGSYTVVATINDANYQGSTTGTLVINKALSTVAIGSLNQTYDGTAKAATATTIPGGLAVSFTYNGSATVPTGAGSYTVVGTINDVNYQGSATGTLVINKASAAVTLGSLSQTYDSTAKAATATTTPGGLAVNFTYNGSVTIPTTAGSYTVVGTINDANYQGNATGTLVINKALSTVAIGSLNQTYDGTAKAATATTTPGGLAVSFTYNGSATVPTSAGSYTVIGTINDANYQGNATGTLVIGQATGGIALGDLSQTYNGTAKPATATTTPSGLTVTFTYNGSATVPTSAGSYTVIGTINDANYQGSATGTLVIGQATGAIVLGDLSQTYNGTAKAATATTTPGGLTVSFTYNGSATVPTSVGSYTVVATINDANYQGSATDTLVINKAPSSIVLGSLSQTYNGTAKPATATTTPSGLTVTFTYNGSATVPTSAGSYTVIGTINDANYQGSATGTLVIGQATGAIALGDLSQTYNGTAKAATATTTPSGLAVSFTYNGSVTVPISVGSYTVVATINDANYQGSATNTLVINAATLTYTANAASMTYGSVVPGLSGSVSGFVGADNQDNATMGTLTFTSAATSSSSVGSYAINGSGLTANNGNYTFVQVAGNATALTINALPVNLTGTRSYDGTTTTAAGILSVANKVGSDNVTVASGSGTLAGANVGSEAITSFETLALGGTAAGNYTLSGANGSVNITVSALALTVTNLLALDKVYDGTTNATLDATNAGLTGMLDGDSVTLVTSNAVVYFADKNIGANKPVTVTGLALGGAAAANYTLADSTNVTADITAAGLTVSGVTAVSKVYDGTTNAELNGMATLNGVVSGDDVSLATDDASAAFASPNVSAGIPVTVSGYVITGADAGNYTLTQPSGLAADITAATLTITATVNTKTYDGLTSASATPTTSGLQGSDSVTGLTETYDTKNAGTGKTLSVSTYTVNDGNSGNNYTVSTATSTAGVIDPATLTITASANTKTYDGLTSASAAPTTSGLQSSDSVTGLAETYDTKDAGTGKTLSVIAYTVNDGNSGNNYTVNTATSTAGVITPATLTITAAPNTKTYDGTTSAAAIPTVSGLQGSDSVTGLTETYDTKNAGTGKTLNVSTYTVNDGNAGANYTVGNVNNIANTAGAITPAILTVTADNKSKICGLPNPPLTASYNGFVGGENANVLSLPAVLSTTATTTSGAGKYPITASDATAANYTIQYGNGTLLVISAPQLASANISVNGETQFVVSWPTITGQTYQLEYTDDLSSGTWTPLDDALAGTGAIVAVTNNISASPHRFFRVQVQ